MLNMLINLILAPVYLVLLIQQADGPYRFQSPLNASASSTAAHEHLPAPPSTYGAPLPHHTSLLPAGIKQREISIICEHLIDNISNNDELNAHLNLVSLLVLPESLSEQTHFSSESVLATLGLVSISLSCRYYTMHLLLKLYEFLVHWFPEVFKAATGWDNKDISQSVGHICNLLKHIIRIYHTLVPLVLQLWLLTALLNVQPHSQGEEAHP